MFKALALFVCIAFLVIGAVIVSADGPTTTTFVSPLPGACPGQEPSDTIATSLEIRATQVITDSLSATDASDFYHLTPRCPTPAHFRPLVIRPLVPGFVPKKRLWIGRNGAWTQGEWDYPLNMGACASDWTQCYLSSQVGCPPAGYSDIYIEVATGGVSQDVAVCRAYSVSWKDTYKTYLPLVVR